jgi:hypothetical protein
MHMVIPICKITHPIEEKIKLSSGVRLSVRNSYLEILPSGTFFQEKNNPRRTTSHNLQNNGQFCCRTRAPPLGFFWQYLSQKSSYKTGAQTQLGARIRRILLLRAVAYLTRSHQHRHSFYWPLFFSIVPSSSRKLMMMV